MDPASITGLNLYSYCGNNPVMYVDPTGHEFISAMLIVLGIILGGTLAFEIAYSNGARGAELFGWTMLGMLLGALAGWAAPYIGTFLGTSFPLVTLTLASGQAITISVTGAELVAASVGLGVLFASNGRPGDNRKQNEQFDSIMKSFGKKKTDPIWREIHEALHNEPPMNFKQLYEFIKTYLGL